MDPLEVLRTEHALIRQALDSFTLAVDKIQCGERPPVVFFQKAVRFLRNFVQSFHHFKEEHVMFVRLAQRKHGALDAQVESLQYQHERGRELIAGIAGSLDGYAQGNDIETSRLLENLAAYTSLLRHHIHREDHVFYPMVNEELSADEMESLAEEFQREADKAGIEGFEGARRLVAEMGSLLSGES